MSQKLTFVNGAKAACGCRHEFSSGGGEYSDVAYVHLCGKHAGAPVLDDRWKARMLDGRAPERDEMGFGNHPDLPWLDEGMMPRSFFAALGLELAHTSAEDQLDGDVLGAMSEAVNWTDWQPTAPQGDGWKLVSIFDTEDGPVAWWLRELPEAEDGTTTIRNLQAEVEKLKARIGRAEAAPAAVAPFGYVNTHTGQFFTEVEPCRQGNEGHWRTVYLQPAAVAGPAWDKTRDSLATLLLGLARRPFLDFDVACIALDAATEPGMPLAYMRGAQAAPALEALAAPASDEEAAFTKWFQGEQGKPYQGMWEFARAAWLARAAAPQAPAPGMAVTALAGEIIAALEADEKDGGYDLTSGLFGPKFSALVRRWAASEWANVTAPQAPDCTRCSGSGEDPEGYLTHGHGPDDHTVDGPCRECDGSGAAPQAPFAPWAMPVMQVHPLETAPKDGTIVQLLVQFVDHPPGQKSVLNGAGPLYDTADPCWTIGGNTVENTGVDHWQFVGWNWEQDCFVDTSTDAGHRVLGWAPFDVAAPAAPAVDAPALGEWVATLEVDSEGGLDYETVPPCTLPPGCYRLYRAAQAKEGGA
ncbi:hypothetical protein DR66_6063 [Delftia acidovorans]|uniref:hypothetical protein n=1 Tax=Delftia acidovorans TaxID=80866 RepID=UPI0005020C9D|nr:hypothetical protein [Delftia acidovorans]KFJ08631.1 hypothetical protein DR66_6063 [Delftia acidovorans]QQB48435.1 hypothetical protein I6H54_18835 [Delftia acidovorans]